MGVLQGPILGPFVFKVCMSDLDTGLEGVSLWTIAN